MFVILVYDVNELRCQKVLKLCRRYLMRVQNSVFEGYLTESTVSELKTKLERIIDGSEDSIKLYCFSSMKYVSMEEIGITKGMSGVL